MTHRRTLRLALSATALAWGVCTPVEAIEMKLRLYGSIVGFVTGPAGAAQMGATVLLVNRYDQLIHRTVTNERGAFGFDSLKPDTYSVRVSQTSFAPASKLGVRVQPGERSFLAIQLASLVSSIQIFSSAPGASSMMTDDWKWVLRTAQATRPVLRWLPKPRYDDPSKPRVRNANLFSDTKGLLRLSAGEMGSSQAASIGDVGTAFALATSLVGSSRVMFSGNVGFSPANGIPAAGFRTSWRRAGVDEGQINPEFRLQVQQVFLPSQAMARLNGQAPGGMPALRSMSASMADSVRVSRNLSVEFGGSLDSVNFLSRMNYFSPYAITTLDLGSLGTVEAAFSSGLPPSELMHGRRDEMRHTESADLARNAQALTLLPRLSVRDGDARLQRSTNYELSYRRRFGSRAIDAGYYREATSNAALTFSGPALFAGDLMQDFNSNSSIFNIGNMRRSGFSASASQAFGEWMTAAIIFSRGGVLRTDQRHLIAANPDEIRESIRRSQQNAVSARIHGSLPKAGTRYVASYQWTDYRALTPGHLFLTQVHSPNAGLNFSVRQPIPAMPFWAGRMELHAEMRNLLAQGYLPLVTPDGQRVLLIHTPRMVRGGLSFFF